MKRKILIIATRFPRWKNDNVPLFIYHFAQSIKADYEVHVLAPHAAGASTYEEMDGLKVHRFVYAPERLEKFGTAPAIVDIIRSNPFSIGLLPFFIGFASFYILNLHLKYKYDVIHVNWLIPFGPVVGFLRFFFNFRYVITAHGSDVFPFVKTTGVISRFVWLLHRLFTVPSADRVVAVSSALKLAVMKMIPSTEEKISVVSMGINYDVFLNERHREDLPLPLKIIFVGRLTEIKGVRYLIEAVRILRDQNIEFELQIYGDGILRKALEDQVNELMLSDCVTLNGFVGHDVLPKKLAESDIFVGPSITTSLGETEGFGLVFLEAMAAGLIVIGSNVGGISDIIKDRETGLLVEEKNPAAIANAILGVVKDDQIRKYILAKGKNLAFQYDWSVIASKYSLIYDVDHDF